MNYFLNRQHKSRQLTLLLWISAFPSWPAEHDFNWLTEFWILSTKSFIAPGSSPLSFIPQPVHRDIPRFTQNKNNMEWCFDSLMMVQYMSWLLFRSNMIKTLYRVFLAREDIINVTYIVGLLILLRHPALSSACSALTEDHTQYHCNNRHDHQNLLWHGSTYIYKKDNIDSI
jgi:hypothetical protein